VIQQAFDRHAHVYDERFSRAGAGLSIRSRFWEIADPALSSVQHLLDLGAGTGEDTVHFAQRGARVTAVDLSSQMIERLRNKAAAGGVSSRVECITSPMELYRPANPTFDGIVSNFGAINCLRDLNWLREICAMGLTPGSAVVLTGMGRIYPLETAIFLLKWQPRDAFRRLRRPCTVTIEGVPVDVYYHSLRSMKRMLGAEFRLERVEGLCAFNPVPGWEHLERSAVLRSLKAIDRFWCRWRMTAAFSDHFVSVWRYKP
jgi:ubiquinone/menaquinone biosynthesis C-methylase UbiE